MARVSLYAPESVPRDFLNLADELVLLAPKTEDPYALFDRTATCACHTRDCLALRGRTVTTRKNHHEVAGFPMYALPEDCTTEETAVVVAWLYRSRFHTFKCTVKDGIMRRYLATGGLFREAPTACCVTYTLDHDPVFMLKTMVVSAHGKGPTLESACAH